MLGEAAARLDISLSVLDPSPDCPAAATTTQHIHGSFRDYDDVLRAARSVGPDAVSVEIESVNVAALEELSAGGIPVHPAPELIRVIQDKLSQRERAAAAGLPVPRFAALPDPGTDPPAARRGLEIFGRPAVQKLRYGGYDGRGVAMVPEAGELPLSGPSLLEESVDIDREIAVLVARTPEGASRSYPPVEMEMDPELHLVRAVLYPAEIPNEAAAEARRIAEAAVADLGGAGIFAVELFIARDGGVLINEIAPRPHNSGHLSIEAAETDQFEQHLRAILGLPLGSTRMHGAAAMVNIIGTGRTGPTVYEGLPAALDMEGVNLHLYGKRESRPGRKMGHVTAIADSRTTARDRALGAAELLSVTGGTTEPR